MFHGYYITAPLTEKVFKATDTKHKNHTVILKFTESTSEYYNIKQLNSKYIIKAYEMISTDRWNVLVLEYVFKGIRLSNLERVDGEILLSSKTKKLLFKQIVNAVDYMHKKGLCNGDIGMNNIMMVEENIIKVVGFAKSSKFDEGCLDWQDVGLVLYWLYATVQEANDFIEKKEVNARWKLQDFERYELMQLFLNGKIDVEEIKSSAYWKGRQVVGSEQELR